MDVGFCCKDEAKFSLLKKYFLLQVQKQILPVFVLVKYVRGH